MTNSKKLISKLLNNKLTKYLFILIIIFSVLFITKTIFYHKKTDIPKVDLPSFNFSLIPIKKESSKEPIPLSREFALYDIQSGSLMAGQNFDTKIPIASITKMTTAIVVLENYQLNDIIEVPAYVTNVSGSTIQLRPGEKISVESLLDGLLINSGNDSAFTLAWAYNNRINYIPANNEYTKKFVDKMNEKVVSLGAKNTHYLDPAGLNDDGYSTVRDQGIIISYALKNPIIKSIISKPKETISSVDGSIKHDLDNSNRLVKDEMYYSGIIGGKTGFTPSAGHSLVTAAIRDNHELLALIFNTYSSDKSASAIAAKSLLDWGFNNLEWIKI